MALDYSNGFFHVIDRDSAERYVAIIFNNTIQVFDLLTGNPISVATPDGTGYLAGAGAGDLRAVTVFDFTFIVNKTKTVAMSGSPSATRNPEALVYIEAPQPQMAYKVYVDGTLVASHTTDADGDNTDFIATQLETALNANLDATFTITRIGSVIHIQRTTATDFTFRVEDTYGNRASEGIKGTVQTFSKLPPMAPDGFTVRIVGDDRNTYDDYFVTFVSDGSNQGGTWEETVEPGTDNNFDAATMPHVLVREAGGTFTFRQETWDARSVGSATSAPEPSFVGAQINDVFFYRNRVGFLSGQNTILSRHGDLFNFFRETMTSTLDTDPIDVSPSHNKVSTLYHALPYNEQLLAFSDNAQFVLPKDDVLTPSTAGLDQTTDFEVSTTAKPIGVGKNVYFVVESGNNSSVREYFVAGEFTETNKDAADVTAHVPTYLPANVIKLTGNTNEDVLFVLSSSDRTALYVYKFFWRNDVKVQASWSRWPLGTGTILDIEVVRDRLYLLRQQGDGVFLEYVELSLGNVDTGLDFEVLLDRKKQLTGVYDGGGDTTTWTLGYADASNMSVVKASEWGATKGDRITGLTRPTTGTIVVSGDYSANPVWVGVDYLHSYTMSELIPRKTDSTDINSQRPIPGIVSKINRITFHAADTGHFKVKVTPKHHTVTYEYPFDAASFVASGKIATGSLTVPVNAAPVGLDITIENDSPYPSHIVNAEWIGTLHVRARAL